ncbi:MAG: hypothetical protein JKY65_30885 [Planctomycetes bacterium]|nr:hypothetical protein [Planctomycetota bacterium]
MVRVPEGEATAFTFSPDGGRLYVGTEEGEIKVLDSERLFGDQVVHLGKDTIRWGPAKRAPTQAPSFSCKARLLSRTDQIAEAFPEVEFLEIELTVKNVGEGAAHCLTGTFPDDPPTVYFGSLPPGASVVRRVWVAAYKARVRPQTFTLTLADQWGHRFRPFNTSF